MNEELKATKIQVEVLEEILRYKDKEIERLNNIIEKALNYIDWVWNNTNKPTNTIVALRTLENILHGEFND